MGRTGSRRTHVPQPAVAGAPTLVLNRSTGLTLEALSPYNRCLFAPRLPVEQKPSRTGGPRTRPLQRFAVGRGAEEWPVCCADRRFRGAYVGHFDLLNDEAVSPSDEPCGAEVIRG